ncbi:MULTISPECIES: C40 family peptidase [unclassified Sphingomonas]|uniref:C40 family peptidase n=2 Tax=Sphingomonas TaxID=13687 RepID=UPI0012E398E3
MRGQIFLQNSGSSLSANDLPTPRPIAPTPNRFALSQHSVAIDRRIDAVRGDLAHIDFAGRVFVPSYAQPIRRVVMTRGEVRADVRGDSEILSEILPGEAFDVLEIAAHRAWGQSPIDGTVGYVDASVLGGVGADDRITHRASPEPATIAEIAAGFVGIPYRAGGRSSAGMDGGGLVFAVLRDAGVPAPRFVDLQRELGVAVAGEPEPGDLCFAGDRVGVLETSTTLICADPVRGVIRLDLATVGPADADRIWRRVA